MLEIQQLCFDFADRPLLHEVNISVNSGEILHLKGSNGAGKTTLMRLIAGLYRPQQGRILYNGRFIHDDLSSFQSDLCYVGHKPGFSPLLTARENLYFDLAGNADLNKIDKAMDYFDLTDLAFEPVTHLSAGQKHRLSLAKLMLNDKKLWLLDEPFVALDKASAKELNQLITQQSQRQGIVIFTSHQSTEIQNVREFSL